LDLENAPEQPYFGMLLRGWQSDIDSSSPDVAASLQLLITLALEL